MTVKHIVKRLPEQCRFVNRQVPIYPDIYCVILNNNYPNLQQGTISVSPEKQPYRYHYSFNLDGNVCTEPEQLTALLALQRGVVRGDKGEACKHLHNVIQAQQDKLEQVEDENVSFTKAISTL